MARVGRADARIRLSVGRNVRAGPQDLLDAVTARSGIPRDQVGAIGVGDEYSFVELPEPVVDRVLNAMRKTRINGKKANVRRFVEK